MPRLSQVLAKSFTLGVSPGDFWPQDWNGSAAVGRLPTVTNDSAMRFPAYFAGVRALSEDTAKLPLIVYKRLKEGRDRAPEHPLYRVLHDVANPEMTAFIFRETLTAHVVSWGMGYSEIQRNGIGDIVALWPLRPDRMIVRRNDASQREYKYSLPGNGGSVVLPANRVFAIPGLSYDGLVGYSTLTILRRAIALGLAAQEYGERTFVNNGRPGAVLKTPKGFPDKAMENLRESWNVNHEGLTNAQRTAILEDGVDLTTIGFPPNDTGFLETQKMSIQDIARGLRLPAYKIGDYTASTNNNVEQLALDYIQDSLSGLTMRWESQANKDLIADPEFYAEHLFDAMLRGDALTRAQALWIRRQAGTLNADEWREIENMNPLPNGDGKVYLQPLNMTTVGAPPPGATADQIKPQPGAPNPSAPAPQEPTPPKMAGVWDGLNGIGVPVPAAPPTPSSTNGSR